MIYSSNTAIHELKNGVGKKAFMWMYNEYFCVLCSYAVTIVKCGEVAQGIVQNLFLKLWEKRKELYIATCLKAYLYNSVRNSCLDHIDHINVKRKHQDYFLTGEYCEIDDDDPESIWIAKENKISVERAVELLPKQCKEVFLMRLEKGFTYDEIANELDISIGTVKTQINRAKNKLLRLLDNEK
jgi:RNA polymerase sigma-70 factor (ECF subfamily)